MRLIDADALLDAISVHLERIEQEFDDALTINAVPATLADTLCYLYEVGWMQEHDKFLTKDVAPVRHGRWIVGEQMPMHDIKGNLSWGNWYTCDQCGFKTYAIEHHITQYNYCPNCGAHMMDEEEK